MTRSHTALFDDRTESQTRIGDLLTHSAELQRAYEQQSSAEARKRRGQFFTPPTVARFMASLFGKFPQRVRLLDPGAGIGILSAAVCDRILGLRAPRQVDIHLFESEPSVIDLLDENMRRCRDVLAHAGHTLAYTIHEADFILSNAPRFAQRSLFDAGTDLDPFDAVIMNPPYFKIAKDSEHARAMDHIVHGQPNIYALFMALGAEMLRPQGELVSITPRSFTNGLYFRSFRRWLFQRMSLLHIHLFESRAATFRNAQVLQESVITVTQRSANPPATVSISTSVGADLAERPDHRKMPTEKVFDDTAGDMIVRIPEHPRDAQAMEVVEAWPKRLTDLGLRVSTGPVVLFRAQEFLVRLREERGVVPLLLPHNVSRFATVWPVEKRDKPTAFRLSPASLRRRLLVPTCNYVLLRRFSAKEEQRRLTASCLLAADFDQYTYIAIENHLNYVYHADRPLTDDEIYGLAALFNSALLDRCFRSLSGNTQVNATDLRTMKLPDLTTTARIGARIRKRTVADPATVEETVLDQLEVRGNLRDYLLGLAR